MSLLEATGQHKKLHVAGGIASAGVAMLVAIPFISSNLSFEVTLGLAALLVLLTAFAAIYAIRSVRCPQCGLRWLSWSMRRQPHDQWLVWLYAFAACPSCGFSEKSAPLRHP